MLARVSYCSVGVMENLSVHLPLLSMLLPLHTAHQLPCHYNLLGPCQSNSLPTPAGRLMVSIRRVRTHDRRSEEHHLCLTQCLHLLRYLRQYLQHTPLQQLLPRNMLRGRLFSRLGNIICKTIYNRMVPLDDLKIFGQRYWINATAWNFCDITLCSFSFSLFCRGY